MTAIDESDLTAADVARDLEPLVEGAGEAGALALLDRAAGLATELEAWRGRVAEMDASALEAFMRTSAELAEAVGRAGSYAGLRFAVDTADPPRGALLAKTEERATAISTRLVFFELEWAALPDERVEELLADERLDFCRHHLRAARRYRPHLLTEPEEIVLGEKAVTGRTAWTRLFDELTSAVRVRVGGEEGGLEQGLAMLASPDRDTRRAAAEAVTEGLAPGLRTRAFVFNTLLADKSVDDRLRRYPTWVASMNLANEASDASVEALVEAVQCRYDVPNGGTR